jgi:hypothetical protein
MRIHVYRDQQIIDRVRRRFDTYGASGVGTDQRERYGYEDPQVLARAADVYFQSVARNRITLETLERTLMSLRSTKGRKSLILVSEGFIYDPNLDDFKRVVQATRRSNVAIYFLDTRGLGGMPVYMTAQYGPALDTQDIGAAFMENYEASEGSESLAADSGGFTVKNTNDLNKGIQRIADESRAYYLIGYNPTNTARDGRFRKISVKVARKGVQVRARKGYYAPLDGGGALVARKPGAGDPDIQAALDSPYEETDIPLRMTAFTFDETLLGKASVVVATEVDLTRFAFDEKEARFVDTMEFLLVVAHRESGEYFRYDQKVDMNLRPETREKVARTWYPIARDFELAPGGYQAKIVVRDKNSGKIGTVIHEFEVPDLSQLRTSTLILSDTVQPQGETATDNRPRPALLVRRDFPQGAMLYASFEVYGAARDKGGSLPRVAAGHVIRKSDGTVYNTKSATLITPTSLGKLSRLLGLSLEGAEPGEYEFVLNVTDQVAGKDLEVREPFRVVPAEAPAASGS